jgi:prepilin-type N-terminal cleavage/methylation domain-containing protein
MHRRGFTLIELLVVIAIIGILSTLSIIRINEATRRTRDSKRWSDIRTIQSAIEICANNGGNAPSVTSNTWNDLLNADCGDGEILGAYFATQVMPTPPKAGTCTNAPSGDCYMYCKSGGKYVLYTTYEKDPPAGGLTGNITSYNPATDCVLSMNDRPIALPDCTLGVAGSFCLGDL